MPVHAGRHEEGDGTNIVCEADVRLRLLLRVGHRVDRRQRVQQRSHLAEQML